MFGLLGKIAQNHHSGKTVLPRLPNLLVWYAYGHDERAKFLVYTLARMVRKIFFIKLKIEPNPDRKSIITANDFFEPEPELNLNRTLENKLG